MFYNPGLLPLLKLDRLHEYVTTAVATAAGMAFAVYCGKLTGGGQMGTLVTLLGGALLLAATLMLKSRVWMIVPTFYLLGGRIPLLPLPLSVSNLACVFVFVIFLALIALKVVRRKPSFDALDLLLLVNLIYLVSVFVRNPVGSAAFGSSRVGGRPYFEIMVGVMAYLILVRASMNSRDSFWLVALMLLAGILQTFIGAVTYFLPWTVPYITQIYTDVQTETYNADDIQMGTGQVSGRHMYLLSGAVPFTTALVAWFRPVTLINPFYIGRFVAFAVGFFLLLVSGFRSAIFGMGVMFLLSSYLRSGWTDVLRTLAVGVVGVGILIALQGTVIELPHAAQRALSFLPGRWSPQARADAQGSTDWRVQMWKEMLTNEKYIRSRVFGDGFGFSQRELSIITNYQQFGRADGQEGTMLIGGVHSGPISTIRYIGVVGLALYLWLTIGMARRCFKIIRRSQGTPFYTAALFTLLPIIYDPFLFVFIFGGLDSAYARTLFYLGLMHVLQRSLDDYEANAVAKSEEPPAPRWQTSLGARPRQLAARPAIASR